MASMIERCLKEHKTGASLIQTALMFRDLRAETLNPSGVASVSVMEGEMGMFCVSPHSSPVSLLKQSRLEAAPGLMLQPWGVTSESSWSRGRLTSTVGMMKRSLQLKDEISLMSSSEREKSNTWRFCWILEGVTLFGTHTTPLCTCHLPKGIKALTPSMRRLRGCSDLPEYDLRGCSLVSLCDGAQPGVLQQTGVVGRGPGSVSTAQRTVGRHTHGR